MPQRRILSIWFPRLAAERALRLDPSLGDAPFAVVAHENNSEVLASLSEAAEAEGLRPGQPLRDARAFCPELMTRPANPPAEAAFLARLRRWSGRFTPFVAEEPPAALMLDISGCAHLFGGETALAGVIAEDCARFGLSVRTGIADTPGAAWALARYAHAGGGGFRSGDAIDQEARATRSRAAKRHWTRGGMAPRPHLAATAPTIAPPGRAREVLSPLPVAALRLPPQVSADLLRLGVKRIGDLAGMPRAGLARRFGRDVVKRLDQAFGVEPEPVTPARPEVAFAARLTLPDPIGLEADVLAALDRLLPPFCAKLRSHGKGARRIRLDLYRADRSAERIEAGLARPSHDADQIRPLIAQKLHTIDSGFGIDALRIEAVAVEPLHPVQHSGHAEALSEASRRQGAGRAMDDLVTRLGGRIGLEAITRLHPADSHIPEKAATVMGAAWSEPAAWPKPDKARPLIVFAPEIVATHDDPRPPAAFRWRRRAYQAVAATGPERIAPEWWLDDPAWRSGVRDYWRVDTACGTRLWLFFAHGAETSGGWFCHGVFG